MTNSDNPNNSSKGDSETESDNSSIPPMCSSDGIDETSVGPEGEAGGYGISKVLTKEIGPYNIIREIGEGGMGSVFEAEQREPVKRKVAIKIIKTGRDSKSVIARFEAERQALAMMDHPSIARIIDAGTTDLGQPFFAMELVNGVPLTTYCDDRSLSVNDRLNLFCRICEGIQHAHQKGIIHRDLKPGNILVTEYDGLPAPKIIDFGLAKALESSPKLTDKSIHTEFGQVLGTVKYMSPEQAGLDALDIDTRTDIYSLGVILYELLTGSTPIENRSIRENAILKVLELVREQEPPKPSSKLSTDSGRLSTISSRRQIEPRKLGSILAGELDWVILKSLEKDRNRRYASANEFAEDVKRYLNEEPILARPPSRSYQLQKFVRKNKGLVASLATIATLLIAGTGGTAWFAIGERSQRKVAQIKTKEAAAEAKRANKETVHARNAEQVATDAKVDTEVALARSFYTLAHTRWGNGRTKDAIEALELVPQRYRNFEWNLAKREFSGSDVTCYGHSNGITSVAYSSEVDLIVSGSEDNTIRLWHPVTGEEVGRFIGHDDGVTSVSFNSDGTRVVSGSKDNMVRIWDVQSGRQIRQLDPRLAENVRLISFVGCVGFSPNNRVIAAGKDNDLHLWDADSGKWLNTFKHQWTISSLSFSPCSKFIASATLDKEINVWNIATKKKRLTLEGLQRPVCVNYSLDGNYIAGGSAIGEVAIWDASNGKKLKTFNVHSGRVNGISFSPDGMRIASAGDDNTLTILNRHTGKIIRQKGHSDKLSSVSFNSSGERVISGSIDNTVKIWDAIEGQAISTLRGHDRSVERVFFRSDGEVLVSVGSDHVIGLWNTRSGEKLSMLRGHTNNIEHVEISPNGKQLVSGSDDNTVRLWDVETGKKLLVVEGHASDIEGVQFSQDGKLVLSASVGGTIQLTNTNSGQLVRRIKIPTGRIKYAQFGSEDKTIITSLYSGDWGSDSPLICVFDVNTGDVLENFLQNENGEQHVCFAAGMVAIFHRTSNGMVRATDELGNHLVELEGQVEDFSPVFEPKGKYFASGGAGNSVQLWDFKTGELVATLIGHAAKPNVHSFNPAGTQVLSTDAQQTTKLWNVENGVGQTLSPSVKFQEYKYSPDCLRIASHRLSGYTIQLYHSGSGAELKVLRGRAGYVRDLAFSPDSKRLVSAHGNGTIKIWDGRPANEVRSLKGHDQAVRCTCVSPDGSLVASGSEDASVRVWDPRTGGTIWALIEPVSCVRDVSFSPDGKWLVAADEIGAIWVWNMQSGEVLNRIRTSTGMVHRVRFGPDGKRLYAKTDFGRDAFDFPTGERLEISEWLDVESQYHGHEDLRWVVVPNGNDVLLVDRQYKHTPDEKAYRELKAKSVSEWHFQQRTIALQFNDLSAQRFHLGHLYKNVHENVQPNILIAMYNLAKGYQKAGRTEEATELYETMFKLMKIRLGPEHPTTIATSIELSLLLINEDTDRAFDLMKKVYEHRQSNNPNAWSTFNAQSILGEAMLNQKKFSLAKSYLVAAYTGLKRTAQEIPKEYRIERLNQAVNRLIELAAKTADNVASLKWEQEKARLQSQVK